MNTWLIVAAAGMCGVAVAHSYLGERYILIRLFRRENLPRLFGSDVFTKRTLRFAWHATTVAWLGYAALLWALGHGSADGGLRVLSVMSLLTSATIAIGSRGRHLAWPVFLIVAIATWMGAPFH